MWPPRRQLAVAWWAPLLCRYDVINWDAVFNSDGNRAGKEYAVEIDGLLHQDRAPDQGLAGRRSVQELFDLDRMSSSARGRNSRLRRSRQEMR
jgi:hypothetical protein